LIVELVAGSGAKVTVDLSKDRATIGRDQAATLTVGIASASSHHATIFLRSGRIFVDDLASTNGVYIDTHKIAGPYGIAPSERFQLGYEGEDIWYEVAEEAPPTAVDKIDKAKTAKRTVLKSRRKSAAPKPAMPALKAQPAASGTWRFAEAMLLILLAVAIKFCVDLMRPPPRPVAVKTSPVAAVMEKQPAATSQRKDSEPAEAVEQATVNFDRDIAPLLERRCLQCHNPEKDKGDLSMHTRFALDRGPDFDAVLVPGKPDESPLYLLTILDADHDDIMPAKGEPLRAEESALIKQWIAEGAPWPVDRTLRAPVKE